MSRALRILLVANDGFSTGHVTRTLAIARGLARGAAARSVELSTLLVTTSEADTLLAGEPIAVVRLPAPQRARRSGIADPDRRRLVRSAIDAVVDGFAPDLIVVDTFPSGPHGELAGLGRRAKRVLVRRSVPDPQADLMTTGLGDYDAMIVADDAGLQSSTATIRQIHVPPILLGGATLDRAAARRALGIAEPGRSLLVTAGGGGDEAAAANVRALAAQVARISRNPVVLALGPLDTAGADITGVTTLRVVPLQPYLPAFDGAFAAAGYNTAHELAHAGIPAALFALPRPFDDQLARARRLDATGSATVLASFDDDAIASALGWMQTARPSRLACDGADRTADALFELIGVRA